MGYFNISGLEPIADGLKAIAKALAGPERQQDYALTPVVRIPDIPRELPTEPQFTLVDGLLWMMDQPELTSSSSGSLYRFVHKCALEHDIDLAAEQARRRHQRYEEDHGRG